MFVYSEISNMSKEVLFEVWNQSKEITKSETFLGLGIVSIDELMITQTQRLVVPLQGNPESFSDGNTAIFGGLLTVHFLLTQNEKTNEFPLDTNGHQVSPEDAIETVADTNGENRKLQIHGKKWYRFFPL